MDESVATAAPAATPTPAPGKPGARMAADDLAAHLDSLEAKPADETPAPEAPKPEEPGEDGSADRAEEGKPAPEGEDTPPDADLDRRLNAIQKQSQRDREQVELKRLEMLREVEAQRDAIRSEWEPKVKEAQKLKELHERAKDDPGVLADEYGWTPDEQAQFAQMLWTDAHAKKGDAKYKAAADNMRRDREFRSKTSAQEKRMAELEKKLESQDAERRIERVATKAAAAVGEKHPILSSYAPEYRDQQLRWATSMMREKLGRDPEPKEVADVLETHERQLLLDRLGKDRFEKLGLAKPAAPKTQTKNANETKVATPMNGTTQKKPLRRGQRASVDDMLAAIEAEERATA